MSDPTKTKAQINEHEESSELEFSFSGNLGVLSELGGNSISPYNGPAAQYRFPFPNAIMPPVFSLTSNPIDLQNPLISPDPRSDNFTTLCHEPANEEMSQFDSKQNNGPQSASGQGNRKDGNSGGVLTTAVHHPHLAGAEVPKGWFLAMDGDIYQFPKGTNTPLEQIIYQDNVRKALERQQFQLRAQTASSTPIVQMSSKDGQGPSAPTPDPYSNSYTTTPDGTGHIRFPAPIGTPEITVLTQAIVAVYRVSEEEAEDAILTENLRIPDFKPQGHGPAGEGKVWQNISIPPRFMERLRGEPTTTDLAHRNEPLQKAYALLRDWISQQDTITGTETEQVGQWIAATKQDPEVQAALEELKQPTNYKPRSLSHHLDLTGDLAQLLTWDRARLARTAMAAEGREERQRREQVGDTGTTMLDELRRLELDAVARVPEAIRERISHHPNAELFAYYEDLRRALIPVEGKMEGDNPGDHLGPEISARIADFGNRVQIAAANYGNHEARAGEQYHTVSYPKFFYGMLQALVAKGEARTAQENRDLLAEAYRAFFTMFQLLGYNEERAEDGKELESAGRKGARVMGLLKANPDAIPISARFLPQKDLDAMGLDAPPEKVPGYPLRLFTWYDHDTGEWVLADYTDHEQQQAGKIKENRAAGTPGGPMPARLFAMLDDSLRFPRGAIIYQAPGEGTHRIQRTHADVSVESFFKGVGFALLAAATILPSAGASAFVFTGLVITSIAEVSELHRKETLGVATAKDYIVAAADLTGALSGAGMAALKIGGRAGAGIYRALQVAEIAGDTFSFAFYTKEAYDSITQFATLNPDDAWGLTRLILFNIAMGTMQGVGIRGGLKDAKAGKGSKMDTPNGKTRVDDIDGDLGRRQERLSNLEHKKGAKERSLEKHNDEKPVREKQHEKENAAQVPAGSLVLAANGMDTERMRRVLVAALRAIDDLHELGGLALWEIRRLVMTLDIKVTDLAIHLETKKLWAKYSLTPGDTQTLQAIIDDIKMVGYSDEARAFVNRYIDVFPNTKLLNVELKWYFENNFVLAESGKFRQAAKETGTAAPDHMALVKDSGPLELPEGYDPTKHPHIRQAVDDRKRRQAEFNQAREDLKGREEYATQADVDRVNKARARIGRKSEHISEMTLDDILAGRVLVQDAIQKTKFEIEKADNPEVKAQLERELAAWEAELQATDTEAIMVSMGYKRIYPPAGDSGSKSGDMDRIYVKESGGRTLVMEVKGGESYLGSRQLVNLGVNDKRYASQRAQQGNGLYLLDVMLEMEKKNIPEVDSLRQALKTETLDMGLFTLKFQKDGEIGEMAMKNFDISAAYENQHLLNGNQR